jgi:hypothetical protein
LVKKIAFPIGPIISPLASDKLIVFPSVMPLLNLNKHRIDLRRLATSGSGRGSAGEKTCLRIMSSPMPNAAAPECAQLLEKRYFLFRNEPLDEIF